VGVEKLPNEAVNFWTRTVIRFFTVALASLLLAFAVSLVATLSIAHEGDDWGLDFFGF